MKVSAVMTLLVGFDPHEDVVFGDDGAEMSCESIVLVDERRPARFTRGEVRCRWVHLRPYAEETEDTA